MEMITLRAHFDGKQILLDDPIELPPNTSLLVVVIDGPDAEQKALVELSAQGLAMAYADDEPEYSLTLIKEQNPTYARR